MARIIRNVEAMVKANPKDAEAAYTLGRLHALAYIRGEGPVALETDRNQPPWGFSKTDRIRRPRVARSKPSRQAVEHLRQAVRLYSRATKLDPKHGFAHLGLGWILLQGADFAGQVDWPLGKTGEKRAREQWVRTAARSLHTAFDVSEKSDLSKEYAMMGEDWSVAWEAGQTLLNLYKRELAGDPQASAHRTRISKAIQALGKVPKAITPIVFPLDRRSSLTSLVNNSSNPVRFDLAGDTRAERWPWLGPNAALLVWDPLQTGKIASGIQLFGSRTWQMFWRHGYQPLAALDDDRSGWLSGNELGGIAAWVDRNGNGVAEPGEVVPVSKLGITGIAVRPVGREAGVRQHPAGLRYSDGGTGPTYDWTPTSVGR